MPSQPAQSKADRKQSKAERKRIKAERKRIRNTSKEKAATERPSTKSLERRLADADKANRSQRHAERVAVRKAKDIYGLLGWKKMYVDGLCLVEDGLYSETIRFSDVSYQSARPDLQENIFNVLCGLVNFFGPDVHVQYMVVNTPLPESEIGHRKFVDVDAMSPMYPYADEYNRILNHKVQEGVSNITRSLYISYSVEESEMRRAVQSLASIRGHITTSLTSIGSACSKLNGQERLELIWSLLHPGEKPEFDLVRDITLGNGLLTDKDLVAPMAIDFDPGRQGLLEGAMHPDADFLLDNGWSGQVLSIQSFGSELSDDAISSIVDLPLPMVTTWHIHGWDKSESIRKVRNADAWIDKEIMTEQQKNAKRGIDSSLVTPSLRHKKDETEEVLHQILNNNQRIYEYTGLVYVYAKTKDDLLDAATQVIRTARQSSLVIKKLPYQQKEAINSVLPLANNLVEHKRTLTTAQVAIQVPFATQELSQPGGIYIGQNKQSSNLVIVDRKGLDSPMGFICGVPGSGKSFSVKLQIAGIMMSTASAKRPKYCPSCKRPLSQASDSCPYCGEPLYHDQIICLDPAFEVSPIVEAFGGVAHDMGPDSPTHLNIFDRSDVGDKGLQSQYAFKVDALIAMMAASMSEGSEGLTDGEKSLIDRVVNEAYASAPAGCDPTLGDFYERMLAQQEPAAHDIALRLERYVSGAMSFFNNQSNIDFNNRLVDIGLRELSESARAFGMILVLEAIRNRMYYNFERGITTWLFIDEVQSMFTHPAIISYFSKFWAEGRKFGLIATGITQNSTRILRDPDGATLINNSDFVMLLRQSSPDAQVWAQMLNLSGQELSYVSDTIRAGDGLLKCGSARIPIKGEFPTQGALYKLFSTKASEIAEERQRQRFEAAAIARETAEEAHVQPMSNVLSWDSDISALLSGEEYGAAWAERLSQSGISTIGDLRGKTARTLMRIDGIGPAAIKCLESALDAAGFGSVLG